MALLLLLKRSIWALEKPQAAVPACGRSWSVWRGQVLSCPAPCRADGSSLLPGIGSLTTRRVAERGGWARAEPHASGGGSLEAFHPVVFLYWILGASISISPPCFPRRTQR